MGSINGIRFADPADPVIVWPQLSKDVATDIASLRSWTSVRNTNQQTGAGAFVTAATFTITDAVPGWYHVTAALSVGLSESTTLFIRLLAGAENLSRDMGVLPASGYRVEHASGAALHAGGDLTVTLFAQVAAGALDLQPGCSVTASLTGIRKA